MGEKDEARGRSTDEKIGCINKEQQNLSFMIFILAKAGNGKFFFIFVLDSLRARGPMGRRPTGVYPVLDTGQDGVKKNGVKFLDMLSPISHIFSYQNKFLSVFVRGS